MFTRDLISSIHISNLSNKTDTLFNRLIISIFNCAETILGPEFWYWIFVFFASCFWCYFTNSIVICIKMAQFKKWCHSVDFIQTSKTKRKKWVKKIIIACSIVVRSDTRVDNYFSTRRLVIFFFDCSFNNKIFCCHDLCVCVHVFDIIACKTSNLQMKDLDLRAFDRAWFDDIDFYS